MSTPERKKEYVKRWLEHNAHYENISCVDRDKNVFKTTEKQVFHGESSTSPIIRYQKNASERKKIARLKHSEFNYRDGPFLKEDSRIPLSKTKSIPVLENILEDGSDQIDCSFSNEESSIPMHVLKKSSKLSKILNQFDSQLIESVSSEDKSTTKNSDLLVLESNSDSDKTASDVIEEISTQFINESSEKFKTPMSQDISNPSSNFSESVNDNNIFNMEFQTSKPLTSLNLFDTIDSSTSKDNECKTSCILHNINLKTGRKKNPKKGSLLEILVRFIIKERSSVNLLRHQLHRKPINISDKPFILLQIVEHLNITTDSQILKSQLIEDSQDLLKRDLPRRKANCCITLLNNPEISSIINVNHKPILKVFEPWIIVDHRQLILHITRFNVISSNKEQLSFHSSPGGNNFKLLHQFHGSCIVQTRISERCNDCIKKYDIVEIVCSY